MPLVRMSALEPYGVANDGWQPLIGKHDLLQLLLGVIERVVDDRRPGVLAEQAVVEHAELGQRGKAELARLDDGIAKPLLGGVFQLRRVALELDLVAVLVVDPVQVVQAPFPVGNLLLGELVLVRGADLLDRAASHIPPMRVAGIHRHVPLTVLCAGSARYCRASSPPWPGSPWASAHRRT